MIRTKLGLLGLCAVVLGMMAMSAGAAQGATLSWLILNAAKTESTNLKALLAGKPDTNHLTLDGEVAGLKIAVTCTGFSLKEAFIEPVDKLFEKSRAIFTGCKVFKEAALTEEYKCTVRSPGAAVGTIETNEFKGLLELVEGEVLTKIEPLAGPTGNLVTLLFEGAECVLPEVNQLHGTVYAKDCLGFATTHKVEHLIESAKQTRLYIGGHSAKQLEVTALLGSVWIRLGGTHEGLEWAGRDV